MNEANDPEIIRLFGKKISLLKNGRVPPVISAVEDSGQKISFLENGKVIPTVMAAGDDGDSGSNNENSSGSNCDCTVEKIVGKVEEDDDEEFEEADEAYEKKEKTDKDQDSIAEESQIPSQIDDNSNPTQTNGNSTTEEPSKNEKDQDDIANPQQKTLKKPDKILSCPRCNSMDTKFCYYNNYNVHQPRHFCKSCQRYWTAGGSMRNVPVGAGRRKNKTSSAHCGHINICDALQVAGIDAANGYHHPMFKPKGTVLSFGSESPLCPSTASVLNLLEKKSPNGIQNGYYKLENGMSIPCKGGENVDDCSSGSSITTSSPMVDAGKINAPQEPVMQNMNGFPSPIPCLPGVPWSFQWNPSVPMPAMCPPGFPMPFYPAPYWNCSVPGPWNIPWLSPTSPTVNQTASASGPNSPSLGKHSRDGELIKPNTPEGTQSSGKKNSEGSVLVPKTLRIDDPDEAAKSSIWATLGIKYDSVNRRGIFNGFQSKADEKKHVPSPSPVLQANPAAFSRALSYQENA